MTPEALAVFASEEIRKLRGELSKVEGVIDELSVRLASCEHDQHKADSTDHE